jgi:peptide/nickel transport system permease protein
LKNNLKNLILSLIRLLKKALKRPMLSFSLCVIVAAIFISILGANIRPDSSLDSNRQIAQIGRLEPGQVIRFLSIRKNKKVTSKSFFDKLFFGGEESVNRLVPIYNYEIVGSEIIVEEYTGESNNLNYVPSLITIDLVDVLYPIDISQPISVDVNQKVTFRTIENVIVSINREDLIDDVINNNIIYEKFYLGTDKHGRDLLSRLMSGTIVSLSIGTISVIISLVLGLFFGAVSGYYGGWVDDLILWFINIIWSIPGLLLIISLTLIMGKGFVTVFIAVGLTMWVELARVVRGQVIALREMDYILAGKALGYSNFRIITKHIIPNVMDPVIVICAANFASAILIEAGLSFLGIGVQIPTASWGAIIEQHKEYIVISDKAYLALIPGFLIIILVFAFMILGNHFRDVFGKKQSSSSWNKRLKGAPIDHL